MLSRLLSLDAIDAPFALGDRVMPPPAVAAVAPKAVADWTRATMADILTDAERGALAEAFPVPKCIAKPAVDMHDSAPVENRQRCRIDLSSANDAELRAIGERMATARQQADIRRAYGIGVGLASTEAPAAKADVDGWIEHDGGPSTLPPETKVVVRMGTGRVFDTPTSSGWYTKGDRDWWNEGSAVFGRIVAYRVVPQ